MVARLTGGGGGVARGPVGAPDDGVGVRTAVRDSGRPTPESGGTAGLRRCRPPVRRTSSSSRAGELRDQLRQADNDDDEERFSMLHQQSWTLVEDFWRRTLNWPLPDGLLQRRSTL